jgi:hypothetical protein
MQSQPARTLEIKEMRSILELGSRCFRCVRLEKRRSSQGITYGKAVLV